MWYQLIIKIYVLLHSKKRANKLTLMNNIQNSEFRTDLNTFKQIKQWVLWSILRYYFHYEKQKLQNEKLFICSMLPSPRFRFRMQTWDPSIPLPLALILFCSLLSSSSHFTFAFWTWVWWLRRLPFDPKETPQCTLFLPIFYWWD